MDNKRVFQLWQGPMMSCPYDPVHRVEKGTRFQRHLIECRKNHPDVEEVICQFNRTHRIKAPEYAYHIEHCPDNMMHRDFVEVKTKHINLKENVVEITSQAAVELSENWEDELLSEPISIPSIAANKNIKFIDPYMLSNLKPRHKKNFRKHLRNGNIKLDPVDFDTEEQEEQKQQEQNRNKSNAKFQENSTATCDSVKNVQPKLPMHRPLAANPERVLGSGRGVPVVGRPRIAANIFGVRPQQPSHVSAAERGLSIGIGRGKPLIQSLASGNTVGNAAKAQTQCSNEEPANEMSTSSIYCSDSDDDDDDDDDDILVKETENLALND